MVATSAVWSRLAYGPRAILKYLWPFLRPEKAEVWPRSAILIRTCEARRRFAQGLLLSMVHRRIRLRHDLPLQKNRGF